MKPRRNGRFKKSSRPYSDNTWSWFVKAMKIVGGYSLEKLLNQLFQLFELAPHAPFKRHGEQIDGAFVLDREHFLLESKWQKKQPNLGDLRDLDGAVSSSLDNTLGLFVSVH